MLGTSGWSRKRFLKGPLPDIPTLKGARRGEDPKCEWVSEKYRLVLTDDTDWQRASMWKPYATLLHANPPAPTARHKQALTFATVKRTATVKRSVCAKTRHREMRPESKKIRKRHCASVQGAVRKGTELQPSLVGPVYTAGA